MEKNQKHNRSIGTLMRNYFIGLYCLSGLFVIEFTVMGILYLVYKSDELRISLFVVSLVLLVVLVLYAVLLVIRYARLFYGGIFKITSDNYEKIAIQKKKLESYPNARKYQEFDELNNTINNINEMLSRIIINNGELDYKKYDLHFLSGYPNVVTYDSFERNYKKIMDASVNFRHAFISLVYPRNIKPLSREEIALFYLTTNRLFKYKDILIAIDEPNREYLIYIPKFDSLNYLEETVEKSIEKYCVGRNTNTGYELIGCKAAAVVYPYSRYDDIFQDLRFAKRQGKYVNFYIPDKSGSPSDLIMSEGRNTAVITKNLEKLTNGNVNEINLNELSDKINNFFNEICEYFSFDYAGVTLYKELTDNYVNEFTYKDDPNAQKVVDKNLINALDRHADNDNTIYFSNRHNISQDIGRYLDTFGIESGFYYIIKNKGKVDGVVFFLNKKPVAYDSYIRESFLIFSFYIAEYMYKMKLLKEETDKANQLNNLLLITGCGLYSVNSNDFTITSFSPEMKKLIPQLEVGKKCYECLHNRTKRCDKCPLKNGTKILTKIGQQKYESSLVLSHVDSAIKNILLFPMGNGDECSVREKFDRDLLTNSYYSFIETIKDLFLVHDKGYMLISNIDNIDTLVDKLDPETLNTYLRDFFNDVKHIYKKKHVDVYTLSNKTFAIILPGTDNNYVMDFAEKVYTLSKKNYLGKETSVSLNISYFVLPYPFGYTNTDDYSKFIRINSVTHEDLENKDFIYVNETKYARSASHEKYLLDVLNTSISSNTFKVKLQPVVTKKDRKIVSAELLFRIADINRGGELNTFEVIQAAAKENKIHTITGLLLDYIEYLYENYQKSMFDKYSLSRLAINVDYSFFKDLKFFERLKAIKEKYKLDNGFIQFEIVEKEIEEHVNEFASTIQNIKSASGVLVCDNYTGEHLTLDKLAALGFNGVKIDRKVISEIDKDETIHAALIHLLETARKLGLSIGVVGVETPRQYALLREINMDFDMQGYYFYRPIDERELLNVFLKTNS